MFLRCFYFFAKSEPHVFNDLFFNKRKVCNHLKKNIKCSRGDYVNLYILLLSVIMVTLDEKSNLKSKGSFGLRKKNQRNCIYDVIAIVIVLFLSVVSLIAQLRWSQIAVLWRAKQKTLIIRKKKLSPKRLFFCS